MRKMLLKKSLCSPFSVQLIYNVYWNLQASLNIRIWFSVSSFISQNMKDSLVFYRDYRGAAQKQDKARQCLKNYSENREPSDLTLSSLCHMKYSVK